MVQLVKHDLEFILKQIKIAEAHSTGTPLNEIRVDANGNISSDPNDPLAVPTTLSPYGLRTVNGSYNNLVEGRDQWGAADNPFPRVTTPSYRDEDDDAMPFPGYVGPDSGNNANQNNDYGQVGQSVVDADPRIISNLIVDQTLENPAAISAALTYAGITGAAQTDAINEIRSAYAAVKAATTDEAQAAAQLVLDAALAEHSVEMDGKSVIIPNVAPDEGLSAPYNGWFTLFGQFFDHGLDLVSKTGGTVYIPLAADDPLYNPNSPRTNFMVLTRTADGGDNLTTPWVDQNQTYTSHSSHQLFLREYTMLDGKPVATGKLLEGERGLATWADVKKQALEKLGVELSDADVTNIPLFVMDDYGEFVRGPNGFPQIVRSLGEDGKFGGDDDVFEEGNPGAPISTIPSVRTGHAFLDDIAHDAKTVNDRGQKMYADDDDALGVGQTLVDNPNFDETQPESPTNQRYLGAVNPDFNPALPVSSTNPQYIPLSRFYDDEKLDAHYITGDGRGNENIGLSAVHHVFHSEHNHTVEQVKVRAIESGDLDFLNEWLLVKVTDASSIPGSDASDDEKAAFAETLTWDGERLFQAARFTTEMQYQHLVFEEFARKVQPDVDAFVFNPSVDINPAIFAEFAHVVYRFGHSMLNQQVAATDADGTNASMDLFEAFLNPVAFGSDTASHEVAAGAIIRGMTSQVGNEIDEFVTDVLRNQLVGIPLDLAALNIARGRETGIPPLNEARRQFKEAANGDSQLDPYTSWIDFALNLKNPASIVNFIAAYGTHADVLGATTVEAKRNAAMKLVFGDANESEEWKAGRDAFLNGTGEFAAKLGGLEDVDLWVGGLAEKKMAFGGMLGSTFSFIFELQLENLQNADRFYYLSRVQGLNFLNELENNSFAKMVMANTDLEETGYALPGDVFSVPDHVIYMDANMQAKFGYADPQLDDPWLGPLSSLVERRDAAGNLIEYEKNEDGTFKRDANGNVIPVDPADGAVANYVRVNTNDHVLIQGTNGNDIIVAGGGDDSVWGRDGNDRIEAGYGVDRIHGGKGDDIITNSGTDIGETDMLHGEEGNDVIHGGSGLALVFGNQGQDYIVAGPDGKEVFGGTGDDFILGGEGDDFLLGNEGDDWIEAGNGFDTTAGDNSELNFNSTIIGHDVMFAGENEHDFDAESGDDIMVQGESVMRNEGMFGFDWAIHKFNSEAADSDLITPIFTTDEQDILRDRFDQVEALSGWEKNDVLRGDNRGDADAEVPPAGVNGDAVESTFERNELTQAGVDRIDGLRDILGELVAPRPASGDLETIVAFDEGNILLGGGGSDLIEGRGGNDYIDGDNWLNVRIGIFDANGSEIGSADSMAGPVTSSVAAYNGKVLNALMLDRAINPGQLKIIREIVKDDGVGDNDVAAFWDVRENYTITDNGDGTLRVEHTGFDQADVPAGTNLVSDGTDKVRNIETLRFAGVDYAAEQFFNRPHTGNVSIVQTPNTTNGSITAVSTVADPDGFTNARFQWQALSTTVAGQWDNIPGATNATFVPPPNWDGRNLRVVQRYEDNLGRTETVVSNNAAVVGNNATIVIIIPLNGNDTLNGTDGADLILGLSGADTLNGNGGNDTLVGADHNDTLNGGAGADAMSGGNGNDTYVVDDAGDTVTENANAGTDTVQTTLGSYTLGANVENLTYVGTGDFNGTGNTLGNTLIGAAGNDTLNGNAGDDDLVGNGGNDTLNGGAGNDELNGGAGADSMTGGANDDTYVVDNVGDTVLEGANAGTDTVQTTLNSYTLTADVENLTYVGNVAFSGTGNGVANVINGDNGDDTLLGMGGNDTINGDNGNDTIDGGDGNDTINGGGGLDVIRVEGTFGNDVVNGFDANPNGGQDRIDLSALGVTAANFSQRVTIQSTGGFFPDTRITVRNAQNGVIGTILLDGVSPNNGNVTQADFILAQALQANLVVSSTAVAEGSTSRAVGALAVPEASGVTFALEGASANLFEVVGNQIMVRQGISLDYEAASKHEVTVIAVDAQGMSRAEQITIQVTDSDGLVRSGTRRSERIEGTDEDDTIRAGRGHDKIAGKDGNDRLHGEDGNDRIDGGTGADLMVGGRGHDTFLVNNAGDRVVERSGQGNDKVVASVSYSLAGQHVEGLALIGSEDIDARGNGLGNILKGNSGDNELFGHRGSDKLFGASGDDYLAGGRGNDRLVGGRGDDTFVFEKRGGHDHVRDYRDGEDKIDVRSFDVDSKSDLSIRQVGSDVELRVGRDTLVLEDTSLRELDNGDFIF